MTNSNLTTTLLLKKLLSAALSDNVGFFFFLSFLPLSCPLLKRNHRCLTILPQLLPSHTHLTTYLNPHLLYLDHSQGVEWQLPYVTDTLPPGRTLKQQRCPSVFQTQHNHTCLSPHYNLGFLKKTCKTYIVALMKNVQLSKATLNFSK